jgi:hypothetical protein
MCAPMLCIEVASENVEIVLMEDDKTTIRGNHSSNHSKKWVIFKITILASSRSIFAYLLVINNLKQIQPF